MHSVSCLNTQIINVRDELEQTGIQHTEDLRVLSEKRKAIADKITELDLRYKNIEQGKNAKIKALKEQIKEEIKAEAAETKAKEEETLRDKKRQEFEGIKQRITAKHNTQKARMIKLHERTISGMESKFTRDIQARRALSAWRRYTRRRQGEGTGAGGRAAPAQQDHQAAR